jgi:predicted NodU family carbamoyl transferase
VSSSVDYYLSCYLAPPGAESILGVRHDQAIALWARRSDSVELVRLWELERYSGQKHHYWPLFTESAAERLIETLLAEVGLRVSDLRGTWGTPGILDPSEIKIPPGAEVFPVHSLAHLFSGMLMDTRCFTNDNIVALAMDGGPDFVLERSGSPYWYAGCVSIRGELHFSPVESPGYLYLTCAKEFGLEEGTLMALASACTANVDFDVRHSVADLRLYGGREHPGRAASAWLGSVIAEVRALLKPAEMDERFSEEENLRSAVMKIVQDACLLIATRNIESLLASANVDPRDCHLSLTGGFALNCPTNSALMDAFGFKSLLTPPCTNDSGQALGLGLLAFYSQGSLPHLDFRLGSAYYGSSDLRLPAALEEFAAQVESVSAFSAERFVDDIQAAPVAWVEGSAEIGPRALGHRSILADPRSPRSKTLLNQYKNRQWWRPVAPIVLAECAADWFDTGRDSPYMLETARLHDHAAGRIPAVAHLDNSARLQTLAATGSGLVREALEAFHDATGVPVLCNTSLNDKGEPIVNTAAEALTFCLRKDIRVAYVDGHRIVLRPADDAAAAQSGTPNGPRKRLVSAFAGQDESHHRVWDEWTRQGYSPEALFLLSLSPDLRSAAGGAATIRQANRLAAMSKNKNTDFAAASDGFEKALGPQASFGTTAWMG